MEISHTGGKDVAIVEDKKTKTPPSATYKTLVNLHNELEGKRTSIDYVLMRSKINEFYKKYGLRLQSITEKFEQLSRKYFVYEPLKEPPYEQIKMEQVIDENRGKLENGDPFRVWREVLQDGKTKEGYAQELEEYLATPLEISI